MNTHRSSGLFCAVTVALVACMPHRCGAANADFYVSGMIGTSFATLTDTFHDNYAGSDGSINGSLFTAGGAAGYGFYRENGRLRLEIEGRGRDVLSTQAGVVTEDFSNTTVWRASNGWSVLANVWRDVNLTEKVAVYAGGGIGGGGYDYSHTNQLKVEQFTETFAASASVATFAWQAGGGTAYALTDRITLDVGYRFFQIANGTSTATVSFAPGPPVGSEVVASAFSASELFFAIRIYEPFRNWR